MVGGRSYTFLLMSHVICPSAYLGMCSAGEGEQKKQLVGTGRNRKQ